MFYYDYITPIHPLLVALGVSQRGRNIRSTLVYQCTSAATPGIKYPAPSTAPCE